jgi:hypothetical protein
MAVERFEKRDGLEWFTERARTYTKRDTLAAEAGFPSWEALEAAPEIERQLARVMMVEPYLNGFGLGLNKGRLMNVPKADWAKKKKKVLVSDRRYLRNKVEEVKWVVGWIENNLKPRKSLNRDYTSYGLKHLVERHYTATHDDFKYVSNGQFIAAAMIAGYGYQRYDGANVLFTVSSRSITLLNREINAAG